MTIQEVHDEELLYETLPFLHLLRSVPFFFPFPISFLIKIGSPTHTSELISPPLLLVPPCFSCFSVSCVEK